MVFYFLLLLDKVYCCTSLLVIIVNGCVNVAFSSLLSSCITYSFYFCSLDLLCLVSLCLVFVQWVLCMLHFFILFGSK